MRWKMKDGRERWGANGLPAARIQKVCGIGRNAASQEAAGAASTTARVGQAG
jgi:hypothetical protein